MDFRSQLIATLKAVSPVLGEPGVLVIGSEVPNLLEGGAASTLVVSEDVDIGIPVEAHSRAKARLGEIRGLARSSEEPSVWVPIAPGLIEVNFVGMDSRLRNAGEAYVLEDVELPLLVFGALSFLRPGRTIQVEGLAIPLPRPAGLLLEKLVTDRSGNKGDRDILVALGLLLEADESDLREVESVYATLDPETRYAVRSNLTMLSLVEPISGMPDPRPHRTEIRDLLKRLETREKDAR
jgi:hypothetical protein